MLLRRSQNLYNTSRRTLSCSWRRGFPLMYRISKPKVQTVTLMSFIATPLRALVLSIWKEGERYHILTIRGNYIKTGNKNKVGMMITRCISLPTAYSSFNCTTAIGYYTQLFVLWSLCKLTLNLNRERIQTWKGKILFFSRS